MTLLNKNPARQSYLNHVSYLTKDISFDTTDIGSGVPLEGSLPAGAHVIATFVNITEVFNATTDVLVVGTAADDDFFVEAGDVSEGALGMTQVLRGAGQVTADTEVLVKYTGSGTPATTGKATVFQLFVT